MRVVIELDDETRGKITTNIKMNPPVTFEELRKEHLNLSYIICKFIDSLDNDKEIKVTKDKKGDVK